MSIHDFDDNGRTRMGNTPPTCDHDPSEDCMNCANCGECSEILDEINEMCDECRKQQPKPSAYETAAKYAKETAATTAKLYISVGLGNTLFDIPTLQIAQSSLTELLTNAYISGQLDAMARLSK